MTDQTPPAERASATKRKLLNPLSITLIAILAVTLLAVGGLAAVTVTLSAKLSSVQAADAQKYDEAANLAEEINTSREACVARLNGLVDAYNYHAEAVAHFQQALAVSQSEVTTAVIELSAGNASAQQAEAASRAADDAGTDC